MLIRTRSLLKSLWRDESGASAVEYALIAGLVGVLLLAVLSETGIFGTAFKGMFTRLAGKLDEVAPGGE